MAALAAEHQWIIGSGDVRIRQNPAELNAWQQAGHTIFFLRSGWTNIPPFEQASKIFHVFPKILHLAARAAHGTGFEITVRGTAPATSLPENENAGLSHAWRADAQATAAPNRTERKSWDGTTFRR